MVPVTHNITLYQGDYWQETWTLTNPDGTPYSVAGWTAGMALRRTPNTAVIYELTTANGGIVIGGASNNVLTLTIPDSVTSTLAVAMVYDLRMVDTSGHPHYWAAGSIAVIAQVTVS